MEEELISVIVPVYNVEKQLNRCIKSIINQTYKNLEILLVDDGSIDSSGKICDEYSKLDSRIKVIHKINGGLSDARNVGIENATGNFIAFIDSDDFIKNDFYEYLMRLQNRYNADIVECNFIRAYESDIDKFKFPDKKDVAEFVTTGVGALYLFMSDDDEISTNSVVVWNKIYNRKLFQDVRFPVGKLHEDQFTTYRILKNCNIFVTSGEVKYAYFQRNNSIINKNFTQKRFDTFEAFEGFIKYYDEKGYTDFKEKILRRYIKTAINYIPLLNSSVEEEKKENKKLLEKLFLEKFEYTINFIKNEEIHKDKINMYVDLKNEFETKIKELNF